MIKKFEEFVNENESFSIKSFINIVSRYADELNKSFTDDTAHRVVDWLYEWTIWPGKGKGGDIKMILDISRNTYTNGKVEYTIAFVDNRTYSWKSIKKRITPPGIGFLPFGGGVGFEDQGDYQFIKDFDNLEDAIELLNKCGIDTSGITRK
jgi:hypothetical protein